MVRLAREVRAVERGDVVSDSYTIKRPEKVHLNKATAILFHIAARSHVLAEQFGVDLIPPDEPLKEEPPMTYRPVPRPWLKKRQGDGPDEVSFDPDEYAKTLDCCSTYTAHMRLWILNVWNSSYANGKGWKFDLFKALNGLDDGNKAAIAWHLRNTIWP